MECHCELRFPSTFHETWHPYWDVHEQKQFFYRDFAFLKTMIRKYRHPFDLARLPRWKQMERAEVWRDDPYHGRQS